MIGDTKKIGHIYLLNLYAAQFVDGLIQGKNNIKH